MVTIGCVKCPNCGKKLFFYDSVNRKVKSKYGLHYFITLRRLKCKNCHSVHREIPDCIFPYKRYESFIIEGILEGLIDYNTIGFEDFPCEQTIKRWLALYQK